MASKLINQSHSIVTSDEHTLHVEEFGNHDGIVILYLHGGPGAGLSKGYQAFFDPKLFHVIAFDQRACGQSTPFASLENNNTNKLIDDIEQIRSHLNITKWILFGGSWGSTLALCYAIQHPQRVEQLVLRGTFLGRQQDVDWFISPHSPAAKIYPDQYQNFIGSKDHLNSQEICEHYFALLTHDDENIKHGAATRWFAWEACISKLKIETGQEKLANERQIYSLALLECYYLLHDCFIEENHILKNADRISHLPATIIHGRYDLVCQHEASVQLAQKLPLSELITVDDAGHSMTENGIRKVIVDTLNKLASAFIAEKQTS